jgi:ammonium transporter, Amt family
VCGVWGGIAAGVFGLESLGGKGSVSFFSQLVVTRAVVQFARVASTVVYRLLKMTVSRVKGCGQQAGCNEH